MKYTSDILSPQSARVLPWLVALGFFMQMLDGTILNVALPGIARDLNVDPLRMQSVVIAYLLTVALFIPVSGWMADHFGSRRIFFIAIILFTLGSLLCAMAPTLAFLVGARVLQGLGGALLVPVGRLTVLKAYARRDLVAVMSFVTLPAMLGPMLGPVVGGFLVQFASWHWIFLINIPMGVAGALLTLRYYPQLKDSEASKFDVGGFLLFGAGVVLVTIAMEGFSDARLAKGESLALCLLGSLLMCAYWLRSRSVAKPLFSTDLFKTRSFAVGIAGNLFARLGTGAMPFLVPLFLQVRLGLSPLTAGMFMIPPALGGLLSKQAISPVVARFGFRRVLGLNTMLQGLLFACFFLVDTGTPYWMLLTLLSIYGVVNSIQFMSMNTLTVIDLPSHQAASGNSLLSVIMQVASGAGVAMAAILLDTFSGKGDLEMFHHTFLMVGAIVFCTAFIFRQAPAESGKAENMKITEEKHDEGLGN